MFDTISRNRILKASQHALGYTAFEEGHCRRIVEAGRADYQAGIDANNRAELLEKEYKALANGQEQQAIDELQKQYNQLLTNEQELKNKLEREQTLLDRWQRNEDLNYKTYIETGKGLSGFFGDIWDGIKDTAGAIVSASTFGQSCKSAERERNDDANFRSQAEHRIGEAQKELNKQKAILEENQNQIRSALAKKKVAIEKLQLDIDRVETQKKSILDKYAIRAQNEKLALQQEAERRKIAQEEADKANKKAQNNKNTKTFLLLAGFATVAFFILNKPKTTKVNV